MRVLHVFKTYYPETQGGIEQVIHQIAQSTAAHGVKSDIFTLSKHPAKEAFQLNGQTIHQAKCHLDIASTRFSLSALKEFSALVKQADVVHYQYPWPFMDMLHLAARVNKPSVVSYQSDIVKQKMLLHVYRPLQDSFLKKVSRVVATSPAYVKSSPVLHAYQHKIRIIPNGISPYETPLDSNKLAYWRDRCGPRFLLFVGVLRYYKGLHFLLEALQGLDYPMMIVGGGPLEQELKAQAAHLKLNHVQFLGALPDEDKFALLSLCEGFVFPSHLRSEAFGVSLLEAAMMSKPLISCEIQTGTSFINLAGETGWVVQPGSPEALRQAIQDLWEHPEIAQQRGKAARRRYEEWFTGERMGAEYMKLYKELM